ncbi:hypothetical protein KNJ79_09720 [Sphingopyxis indica]|uniref:hypothetical protein n=1 Tax=Sphingopyxis indica TaxID=436663 RepID=UPI0029390451|nr:hypothetical protein [Sphingopyxis indica]WOF45120.1 hypothetical protein KNJ79_09720 [Sphingopyxis indica]
MSDDALVAILTIAIVLVAGSVGALLGLQLVRGSNLKADRPRLTKLTIGIWIAGALAIGAWMLSDGRISLANASFGFALASIAIFCVFRRPKAS